MNTLADVSSVLATIAFADRPLALGAGAPRTGLLVIDVVNGFCTPGAGPLAPAADCENLANIEAMIVEVDRLAHMIEHRYVVRDEHVEALPEDPYPPHCIKGSGDERLVPALAWLEDRNTPVVPKGCINAVLGTTSNKDERSDLVSWIEKSEIERLVVTGIATDICVLGAVTALLSARTLGLTGRLREIVVHAPACATYHLGTGAAAALGLDATRAHPWKAYQMMGLALMANQGATITTRIATMKEARNGEAG